MKGKRKSVGYAAIMIMGISLTGKIFGLLRELLLAKFFGTDTIVDVYLMSYTIPSILFGALPAMGVGFTPIYFEIKGNKEKNQFLNNILCSCILFALICVAFTYLGAKGIVAVCAPGFDSKVQALTVSFLKVTVWSVVLNTPVQILVSYLNCKERYIHSNLSNLTVSLTQALFIVLAAKIDVKLLPYGFLLPYCLQFGWLFLVSCYDGFRPHPHVAYDKYIKKLLLIAVPICISNILVDFNGFVDKFLASYLPSGRLAALNYSFTLRAVFVTVCSTVITTIFYPRISELTALNDKEHLKNLVHQLFNSLMLIMIPLNVLGIVLANEGINLVFMRGSFTNESLILTKYPFIMYMLSLSIIVFRELIIRILYANGDTKSNLFYGGITIGINVILSLLLVQKMQHVGLALATTISAFITFPLYVRKLMVIVEGIDLVASFKKMGKILISSCAMGCIVMVMKVFINHTQPENGFIYLKLLILGCMALVVYGLMLQVLHVEEIKLLFTKIIGKLKKGNEL